MRTLGLILALALLAVLRVEAGSLGAFELDKSKLAGIWYVTARAPNFKVNHQDKDDLKTVMARFKILGGGNLKVTFAFPSAQGCEIEERNYLPTENPGEYYSPERGAGTVRLVDTDGESYFIVLASKVSKGKTRYMLRLYTRSQEASPRVLARFRRLVRESNFGMEKIEVLRSHDDCALDAA